MATIATIHVQAPTERNSAAAALANPCFRKRVVKAKRGKGSYSRRPKHRFAQFN